VADNSSQRNSPAYRLAALDPEFLLGDSMRGVRLEIEYAKAEERLRAWTVRSTIVVFGSARIRQNPSPELAERGAHWYEEARRFGRIASEQGGALNSHHGVRDNVIATGGGPGIMEAANRGAVEAGGKSLGLNIQLPHEQYPNPYISEELNFDFHYFFMRKLWFAQLAKALIVFPGGFGTMDELWEMLTLLQSGKLPQRNLILIYGRKYWDEVLDWRAMVRWGTISESDYGLLQFADTVDDAFERVRSELEANHLKIDLDWMG
jgi:uncharacterized protein (TIGR00730 family)